MKINRSTGYALLAAGYLAKHQEQKIVLSDDISNKYNIPPKYLFKILGQLVKGGVLRSKRGTNGGFSLARPPKKISLLQIIEAVDMPMTNNLYLEEHAKGKKFCKRVEQTYEKAIAQVKNVFKKTTLSDLVE